MKIKKFTIENYKAIRGRKEFIPNGASFFLLGGNGEGKTSAGRALIDMLTRSIPSKPITEGEKEGFVEFELTSGAKIQGRFVEGKRPVLEFITPEGYNVGSPKELFAKLAGEGMDFSIDDFLKLQPKPLREKLEKIAGLDLSDVNNREAEAFEKRKLAKAQLRDQQGRVQPYDEELINAEEISAVETATRIQQLQDQRNTILQQETKIGNLEADVEKGKRQVIQMREELEAYIAHQNAKIKGIGDLVNASFQTLTKEKEALSQMEKVDEAELERLRLLLQDAEKQNQQIRTAKELKKEFDLARDLEDKVNNLELQVKKIREEKEAAIKASPIPAEGVSFSEDGEILIDGLPFQENQIAASRKIIAGIQIASSMLGDIKYLHFDGAQLDKESADQVLAYAEGHGFQLCIERPLWEGGDLKFEIADNTNEGELPSPELTLTGAFKPDAE